MKNRDVSELSNVSHVISINVGNSNVGKIIEIKALVINTEKGVIVRELSENND